MALHHVVVDNRELHGEETQGHRRPPEVELFVLDVLRWSHCLVLQSQNSNSSFVMLLVMIVEMMAMFMILMMMTNKSHLQFREEGKRGQSHLEPSEDELIIMLNWMVS